MLGELQPWFSGWPSLDRFRRDMDELFDRFFGEIGYRSPNSSITTWPAVESFFRDGNWVMRFDLPGVDPKDIDVSVAGDTLTVRASRKRHSDERNQDFEAREISYGRFERSLTLPKGVQSDQIKASYQHGVLELTMPASPELVGRKIPIGVEMEDKKQIEHQAG
jgi:HSP20 family protein